MKNTILRNISEIFCPHNCISCGKVGGILCDCCKNYILSKREQKCLNCGDILRDSVCQKCSLPFLRQYHVGYREGVLKELISTYKYNSVRSASFVLAELLTAVIDDNYVLVPLPTIRRHIRERGFDHIELICKKTGMAMSRALVRQGQSVQVGATNEERQEQAKNAYRAVKIDKKAKYLLVDDVWTTGSSMRSACEVLRERGIKNLAIAVIARSL